MATHELPSSVLGLLPGMNPDESGIGGGSGTGKDVKTSKGETALTGRLLEGVEEETPPGFTLGEGLTGDLFGQLYRAILVIVGKNTPGSTEPSEK